MAGYYGGQRKKRDGEWTLHPARFALDVNQSINPEPPDPFASSSSECLAILLAKFIPGRDTHPIEFLGTQRLPLPTPLGIIVEEQTVRKLGG
jgi:hypothetical protein